MIASLSSLVPLLLLASQVTAGPHVVRRQDSSTETATTTEPPTPWVSVYDDGTASTFTPVISTNSAGQTTTIDAPTATSDSTIDNSGNNNDDVYAKCDSSKYELADTGNKQPFIPFCAPHNGTKWWHSGQYYVTWNPSHYQSNSSVKIVLNYATFGDAGRIAQSWETSNAYGFIDVRPNKDWLMNQTARDDGIELEMDNQVMYFTIADSHPSSTTDNLQSGPTIILTSQPTAPASDTSPRNRPAASTLALAIGLPLIAVFAFGSICCLHFCMRNKRSVGPISIGGGRKHFSKRGYSGRSERRRKAAMGGGAAYRDDVDDAAEISPVERSAEWELANVKGGR